MKNLSKVFMAACCMLLLFGFGAFVKANPIGPQTAKYSFEARGQSASLAGFLTETASPQKAEIMPLPFSNQSASIFSTNFNRNHFLLVSVLLSLTLLVFAHKNHFETDIYEFYHRNQDGMVTFESIEAQRSHFMRAALARILRVGGILCAAAAVMSFILA
jgi:hypothetical protein